MFTGGCGSTVAECQATFAGLWMSCLLADLQFIHPRLTLQTLQFWDSVWIRRRFINLGTHAAGAHGTEVRLSLLCYMITWCIHPGPRTCGVHRQEHSC
jgi:hypothetical protein